MLMMLEMKKVTRRMKGFFSWTVIVFLWHGTIVSGGPHAKCPSWRQRDVTVLATSAGQKDFVPSTYFPKSPLRKISIIIEYATLQP